MSKGGLICPLYTGGNHGLERSEDFVKVIILVAELKTCPLIQGFFLSAVELPQVAEL